VKFVIAFLIIALVALAGMLRTQSTNNEDLQREIRDLNAKLAEKAKTDTLDLRAKCWEQARKAFADRGYSKDENHVACYEDHYNAKLDKCFIHVYRATHIPGTVWEGRDVFDAFEGKEYGTYMWRTGKDKKPTIDCEVTLPSGQRKDCHSEDEFRELAKVYMEGN
jgi:hypothetical protein